MNDSLIQTGNTFDTINQYILELENKQKQWYDYNKTVKKYVFYLFISLIVQLTICGIVILIFYRLEDAFLNSYSSGYCSFYDITRGNNDIRTKGILFYDNKTSLFNSRYAGDKDFLDNIYNIVNSDIIYNYNPVCYYTPLQPSSTYSPLLKLYNNVYPVYINYVNYYVVSTCIFNLIAMFVTFFIIFYYIPLKVHNINNDIKKYNKMKENLCVVGNYRTFFH